MDPLVQGAASYPKIASFGARELYDGSARGDAEGRDVGWLGWVGFSPQSNSRLLAANNTFVGPTGPTMAGRARSGARS